MIECDGEPPRIWRPDRIYIGYRNARAGPVVCVGTREMTPTYSQWVQRVSNDGFEWGDIGPGSAQLALALLLDATQGDREVSLALFQEFKFEVVSYWAFLGWATSANAILRWIASLPGRSDRLFRSRNGT